MSRAAGGGGNDSFVVVKGGMPRGIRMIDFHLNLAGGGEHDTLQLFGFCAAAHLDLLSSSVTAAGTTHSLPRGGWGLCLAEYRSSRWSAAASRLGSLDYHFG